MGLFDVSGRICPNCGMIIPEGNSFCEECGTICSDSEMPSYDDDAPKLYCPNGHNVTGSGNTFCLECGAKLVDTPPAPKRGGWTCKNCSAQNTDDSVFCAECGSPRSGESRKPPRTAGWTCKYCAAQNTNESDFCAECGNPRFIGKPKKEPEHEPEHEEKPVRVIPPVPDIMRPLTNEDMKREGVK